MTANTKPPPNNPLTAATPITPITKNKLEKCQFCNNPGKKVKAHILPEAFFRDISEEGSVLKQREVDAHPKKMPIGVYDDELWCDLCEKKFGRWDDYAISILRTPLEEFQKSQFTYSLEIENPEHIKLFFISLLWRASATTKKFYENVNIGSFAETAAQLLISGSAGTPEQFPIILTHSGFDDHLIAGPVQLMHSGVIFYRFYLGRFTAEIKVDSKPTPKNFLILINGHKKTLSIFRTPRDRGLVNSASKIAQQLANRFNRQTKEEK